MAQGGHEGLGDLRFRETLSRAAAPAAGARPGSTALRPHDLALADTLRLLERTAEAWAQVRASAGSALLGFWV